jgi:hypothetical protein
MSSNLLQNNPNTDDMVQTKTSNDELENQASVVVSFENDDGQ